MQVYEHRPSGLHPRDWRRFAGRNPRRARVAGAQLIGAVVLMAGIFLPHGGVWFAAGAILLVGQVPFLREAGRAGVVRPALILTGTPKWDGTRRVSWAIEADSSDELIVATRRLVDALTAELGESRSARRVDGGFEEVPISAALERAEWPSVMAWGIGSRARFSADGDSSGIWIRVAWISEDDPPEVTVLCNSGTARSTLVSVAWTT